MNAMDAITDTKTLETEIVIRSRRNSSDEALVAVEDCGTGVKPEIASKIFDPFFTTKPHGIGMGLSISRSIIESHEGKLWVSTSPTGGALFQFALPIHSKDSDE